MFYSAAHNVVVYQVDNPALIVNSIAGARRVNGALVAVPATLFALQLARVLGLPVPPILDIAGYDWPMKPGRTPLSHQRHMANFAVLHPRHFNLSEMGTMKTYATLAAADFLKRQGVVDKALILSPLSTLQRVWGDEIMQNFLGRRSFTILHGAREQRLARLREDVDFYIINHDGLGVGTRRGGARQALQLGDLAETIRTRKDINLVIIDEASAYKDGATRRTRILRQTIADKPYVWLLSGTPTPNAPTDAWSLARLIGGLPSESFQSFRGRTMYQASTFKWIPRAGAAEIVRKALTPAVRFTRAECIDLPECVTETRDVELSPTQAVAYKQLRKDLALTVAGGRVITAVNEAVLRMKLIQIACGAVYGPDREVHKTDAAPRLAALREVIDEAGGKILIFAPLTSVVNLLHSELREHYGDRAVAKVYGDVTQGARAEIFRAFEDPASDLRMIAADPGTMAHGLTLVQANTTAWFGPTDKSEIYDQANARMNRPGQTRRMLVVHFASTPVEHEIYKRLSEKASMQGAILRMTEEER